MWNTVIYTLIPKKKKSRFSIFNPSNPPMFAVYMVFFMFFRIITPIAKNMKKHHIQCKHGRIRWVKNAGTAFFLFWNWSMNKKVSNEPCYSFRRENAPSLSLFENDQFFEKSRKKAQSSTKIPNPSRFQNPYQKPKGKYSKKYIAKNLKFFSRKLELQTFSTHSHMSLYDKNSQL